MDEHITKILQEKAHEVRNLLAGHQIICTNYTIRDYGINFSLPHNGKKATLSLYYSQKKNRWKPTTTDAWVQTTIIPLLDALHSPPASHTLATGPIRENTSPASYFETAKYCLTILEPFQNDNVDCSIIIEQAQRDLQFLLKDVHYAHLKKENLQKLLASPIKIDFQSAKEFLSQCLNTMTN